jgi:hypothetical protein
MLRTTSLITAITEVPREWVFENYLSVGSLTGQDVKILSAFNPSDKEPSMFIYFYQGQYRYNDFSTGKKGDNIELVKELFNLPSRGEATARIIADYTEYIRANPGSHIDRAFDVQERFKVVSHEVRSWTKNDQQYWAQFKIGSEDLDFFIVKPLRSYLLGKADSERTITIEGLRIYGYYKKDGTLYKIYQPHRKKNKFVKIISYIQGSEQLTYQVPFLVICSSLKDMMDLKKLGFKNIEVVAPDSENVMIEKETIDFYKIKYQAICTIMDNDEAGIKSMKKYEEEYGLPGIHIPIEKDIADMVKHHGIVNTRIFIQPLLTKTLRGK